MNDFVSSFWGYFMPIIALGGIAWCLWLLYTQRRWLGTKPNGQVEDTGHVWDEDLTELNNPVPPLVDLDVPFCCAYSRWDTWFCIRVWAGTKAH